MSFFPLAFFGVAVLCVVACNVQWYRAKAVLKSRGLPVSYLHDHWRDLSRLRELAAGEHAPAERARLLRLRRSVFGFLFAGLAFFAVFMVSSLILSSHRHRAPTPPASPNSALQRTPTGGDVGSASHVRPRQ